MTRFHTLIGYGLGFASSIVGNTIDRIDRMSKNPITNNINGPIGADIPSLNSPVAYIPVGDGQLTPETSPTGAPGGAPVASPPGAPGGEPPIANPGAGRPGPSPAYTWMYEFPLPIPEVAAPLFTENVNGIPIQYYEATIETFQQQVYPNLGPANLVGYGGTAPGATFEVPKGTETVIRYVNNGNLSSAIHLHGSYTHSPWDGWAYDLIDPGQYKDYYYPNTESARSMWYHDHAHGHTAVDAYYGQYGAYYLIDPAEDVLALPRGKYQIPLALMDKQFQSNGDLARPDASDLGFFGDIIEVNNQPWPFFDVEPRKYRLRVFNMALSRVFAVYFADPNNTPLQFQIIGSDSGLFASPVNAKDFTIAPGERYEVVFDFAAFAGSNITMMNAQLQQPDVSKFADTDKVMRFRVGTTVSDEANNGEVPTALADIHWPPARDVIDHEFNFQMGGADTWTINGVNFSDPNSRVLARPPQGTVQRWRMRHTGGPAAHPVHVHLVNLQVISRTGGARGLAPYETAGLKDVVLITPGETVDVLATYGPWNGMYMFHCHDLIHEDNTMMATFNTTFLRELGYEYESTQGFSDPMDERFIAKDYDIAAFNDQARRERVRMFGNLNAYARVGDLIQAQADHYATAGFPAADTPAAKTVTPENLGQGFLRGVAPTVTALFDRAATPLQTPPSPQKKRSRIRA